MKINKSERISTLEDAVGMNWTNMKKIETKISRAMTDMAIKISNLSLQLEGQQRQLHLAAESIGLNKRAIVRIENKCEPKPQLKTLDQSVFDGIDEKWRFAAVDKSGECWIYTGRPDRDSGYWFVIEQTGSSIGKGYDATDWQNSLIKREKVELTGKKLVKAMLDNGRDKVLVRVSTFDSTDFNNRPITFARKEGNEVVTNNGNTWDCMDAIDNQGEPLTAKEAGL